MIHHTVSQTTTLIHIINYDTYQTDINASTPRSTARSTARNTARNTARVQHGIQTNEQREQREQKDNAEMSSATDISGKDYEERGTPRVTAKAPGNGEEKTTSPQDIVSEFARRYKLLFERPYFITRGKDQRRLHTAIETEPT